MNPNQLQLIKSAGFFLFIFLSGFWLNHSGAPYSTAVLTIHKLIALGAFVFLGLAVYRRQQTLPLTAVELASIILTALLFISTIATGGLLSMNKLMPAIVSPLHLVTPVLILFSTAVMLYLLLDRPVVV